MLHWLQIEHFKKIFSFKKRQIFFFQLFGLVFLSHLFFFLILNLISSFSQQNQILKISLASQSPIYVLSPMLKHVKQEGKKNKNLKQSLIASKIIEAKDYKKSLEHRTQKKDIVKPKLMVEKVKIETIPECKKQKAPVKKNEPTKKKLNIEKIEKVHPKLTVTEGKEDLAQKKLSKKEEKIKSVEIKEKKKEILPVTPKEKKIEKIESVVEKELIEEKKIEDTVLPSELDEINLEDVTFVGYEDLDSVELEALLRIAIQQHFKPPIGISKDVSCDLLVDVMASGKVTKVTVVKSSGVIVYDSAARSALYKAILPKNVWGRSFTISLQQ